MRDAPLEWEFRAGAHVPPGPGTRMARSVYGARAAAGWPGASVVTGRVCSSWRAQHATISRGGRSASFTFLLPAPFVATQQPPLLHHLDPPRRSASLCSRQWPLRCVIPVLVGGADARSAEIVAACDVPRGGDGILRGAAAVGRGRRSRGRCHHGRVHSRQMAATMSLLKKQSESPSVPPKNFCRSARGQNNFALVPSLVSRGSYNFSFLSERGGSIK